MFELIVQQLANGIVMGMIYALVAIGLTLILGILVVINFAQGELYMLGAFFTFSAAYYLRTGYFISTIMAIVAVGLCGILFEKLTVRPLRGRGPHIVLLSLIGLSEFLKNIAILIWGPNPRLIVSPYAGKKVIIGPVYLTQQRILIVCVGILIILLIHFLIKRTKLGMAMRAVARDKGTAALMGIDVDKIYAFTFALGSALAGVAGALLGAIFNIETTMGEWAALKGFVVVIMGGMGNVPGAIFSGLFLGIAETICVGFISVNYKEVIGYVMLILILLYRPQGLFGKKI
jgi:branched-chain amino acid transport system permease protein